ncbi:MAG: DUF2911 domain-containing protein [Balneolaceae bacterium]|nr:DUF2911 domain-containing protein [Balneolaceae bacterium]
MIIAEFTLHLNTNTMKNIGLALVVVLFLASCSQESIDSNNAAFVTYLGNDTLAVEQFEKTGNEVNAKVILRSPRTTFTSYDLVLDNSGAIERMTATEYSLEEGFGGEGTVVKTIERMGDSLLVEENTSEGSRTYSAPYEPGVLPFIDMVHWPYELALENAASVESDTVEQKMLTGSRLSSFILADIEADSMTIRHPFRGVMGVDVNKDGDLLFLDAGLTTRKLKVHREPSVNIDAIGEDFAANDESGNPFGELSSAETGEFSFKGANFRVEYGSPKKRGRDLFGGIVPWGERWRTGANRATHFYTSRDLQIGDLQVPAGEYTLFTIPEPDGGTLMINKQTGQNGQSYDAERDLGRVPMEINTKEDVTEAFTITIEETDSGGVLKLIWGETVFSVDFTIQ